MRAASHANIIPQQGAAPPLPSLTIPAVSLGNTLGSKLYCVSKINEEVLLLLFFVSLAFYLYNCKLSFATERCCNMIKQHG